MFKAVYRLAFLITMILPLSAKAEEPDVSAICHAAISTVMGQELADVAVDKIQKNVAFLSFTKKDDDVHWKLKCNAANGLVYWATETGAWRNGALDSKITYKIEDDNLIIREDYSSGAFAKKVFSMKYLTGK